MIRNVCHKKKAKTEHVVTDAVPPPLPHSARVGGREEQRWVYMARAQQGRQGCKMWKRTRCARCVAFLHGRRCGGAEKPSRVAAAAAAAVSLLVAKTLVEVVYVCVWCECVLGA